MRGSVFVLAVLVVLIALPLIPAALAATSLYSGYAYPNTNFTDSEKTMYFVEEGRDPSQILLRVDEQEYIFSYRECVTSRTGYEQFCFNDSDWMQCKLGTYKCPSDEDHNLTIEPFWCCPMDVKNIKFAKNQASWGAKLLITRQGVPKLTLTRAASSALLDLQERAKITLSVKNDGDAVAAEFREQVPAGFLFVESPDGLAVEGGDVVGRLAIDKKATKTFSYTLEAKAYGKGVLNGSLSFQENGTRHVFAKNLTLETSAPFLLATEAPLIVRTDERWTYSLAVRNITRKGNLTIEITAPDIDAQLPSNATSYGDTITWEGNATRGGNVTLNLSLRSPEPGQRRIGAVVTLVTTNTTYEKREDRELAARSSSLAPLITLTPSSVTPGEEFEILVLLDNSGTQSAFAVDAIEIAAPGALQARALSGVNVAPGETVRLLRERAIAPERNVTITLRGQYRVDGVDRAFSTSATLAVAREDAGTAADGTGAGEETGGEDLLNETGVFGEGEAAEVPGRNPIVRALNRLAAWLKGWF